MKDSSRRLDILRNQLRDPFGAVTLCAVLFAFLISCSNSKSGNDLTQYVDPMIGTDAHGHTFPGATVPFGMVQLSPSNGFKDWDWCSGYHYSDSIIKGFAHNHISGPGLSGLGDILVMPTSKLLTNPGTEEDPESGYMSRFSHDTEKPSPGYYTVRLDDEAIMVELTASERIGYHKYTFETAGEKFIIIDPTHSIGEFVWESEIEIVSNRVIRGAKQTKSGSTGDRATFFELRFSKPFQRAGITQDDQLMEVSSLTGTQVKGYAAFEVESGEAVEVQVTLSHTGYQGVTNNWEAEGKGVNFLKAHRQAKSKWQAVLETITIDDQDVSKKRTFYTAMYHSMISPNLISDVDGAYFLEGEIRSSDMPQFSNFSTWDTYRALHPLLTIINQDKTSEMVASMISRHADEGLILPGWEAQGFDNVCMIGYNMTSPIADAVLKDIKGFDYEQAYAAIRASAFDKTKNSPNYDVNGMESYLKYAFVSGETGSSVSKTTEQNYYDWAIGQVAAKLGKTEDAGLFTERSKGWRHLYDISSGYLYPQRASGEVMIMDTTRWGGLRSNYVSGNIWAYSAYTPHDMQAAIQLHGGRSGYLQWLDNLFQNETVMEGDQHVDISGFIGKYGHGDEPGHQMPYLFAVAGKPWKTQQYVNEVVTTMYSDQPDGLINNEDLGQMSAWYIFSTLGFYPLAPGDLTYQLGAPYHTKATIRVGKGKHFTVVANDKTDENIYIQKARLNGADYTKTYITHADVMAGGVLEVEMGARPNTTWGTEPEDSFLGVFDETVQPDLPVFAAKAPFDPSSDYYFSSSKRIALDGYTEGASIYYTLDGSEPSVKSDKFESPVSIRENTTLKAIATAGGLQPSSVFEKSYTKSFLLDLPEGYPKLEVAEKETPYGKADCSMMFDQQMGSATYSDGKWTGLKDDFSVTVDLGEIRQIDEILLGALTDTDVWIFPPSKISVGFGFSKSAISNVLTRELDPLGGKEKRVVQYALDMKGKEARYIKVDIHNYGTSPEWHGATADQSMWLFVDEITLK